MQFNAKKHFKQLVPVGDFFAKKNDAKYQPRFPRTRRQFYYLVLEAKDKSFIESQCAIFIAGGWWVWPEACVEYAQAQATKTIKRYGKRAA